MAAVSRDIADDVMGFAALHPSYVAIAPRNDDNGDGWRRAENTAPDGLDFV
jgi:hypothetical protein